MPGNSFSASEADHGAGPAALLRVHLSALRAGAGGVPVVHGHGEDTAFRVLPGPFFDPVHAEPEHIRVGEAQLGPLFPPDAVHHGEILRMAFEPAVGGHQGAEGVAEIVEGELAAHLLRDGGSGGVEPQLHGEGAVHGVPPEELPGVKSGQIVPRAFLKSHGAPGQHLAVPGEEAAAHPFQEPVSAVYHGPGGAGQEADLIRPDLKAEAVWGGERRAFGVQDHADSLSGGDLFTEYNGKAAL